MSYITTYTGNHFDPINPDPELINIVDIAHALPMICRGNGQNGAGAQNQTQNRVFFDDAVGKDAYLGLIFLCHFLPTSFTPARCSS